MTTTSVDEKDIPKQEIKLVNAPETIEDAVKRIMELEMRLEDLARAAEIAQITRQFEVLDSFMTSANQCLEAKITIEQPTAEDFKVTIVTNKEDA